MSGSGEVDMKDKLVSNILRMITFVKTDVWRIKANQLPPSKYFFIRQLRIILLAVRGFDEDRCLLRASALTFYCMLSIVPVLAMAFGFAKGFGLEKILEKQLLENFPGHEEIIDMVIELAQSVLQETQGGIIAGIGLLILFWMVVKVIGNIEESFNEIWGVKEGRGLGRKLTDYLSVMVICPILLVMSGSATVLVATELTVLTERYAPIIPFSELIFSGLKLISWSVIWILFTFVYMYIPNTRVTIPSALLGGVVAGSIYLIVQWIYIFFQVGVSKYGAIYGSFAALPLFIVWLQMSWLVVLLGAEIAFAVQNVDTYEFEPDSLKVSRTFKNLVSLYIVHFCTQKMLSMAPPPTESDISHSLDIPIRLVRHAVHELTEVCILSEVNRVDSRSPGYQPARDLAKLDIKGVLSALEDAGVEDIPVRVDDHFEKLRQCLERLNSELEKSEWNMKIKEI